MYEGGNAYSPSGNGFNSKSSYKTIIQHFVRNVNHIYKKCCRKEASVDEVLKNLTIYGIMGQEVCAEKEVIRHVTAD